MTTNELLKKHYKELCDKKAEIDAKCDPIAKKREAIWVKIHALRAEIDELAAKEKAIKGEDFHTLCSEIGRVAISLGGRALGDGSGTRT